MKSERELESVGTTTIPRLDSNASGIVLIVFLTKDDLTAQLIFCGTAPIDSIARSDNDDVVNPTTSPLSLNKGPPLLPGYIGTVVWKTVGLSLISVTELITPSVYFGLNPIMRVCG